MLCPAPLVLLVVSLRGLSVTCVNDEGGEESEVSLSLAKSNKRCFSRKCFNACFFS